MSVTAGNLIVVTAAAGTFGNYNSGVSDTAGNSYTDAANYSPGAQYAHVWYTVAGSTASITITGTGSAVAFRILIAQEFSGFTAPTLDKTAVNNNQSANPLVSGTTATTTAANELVVGSFYWTTTGAGTGATAGSGYSNLDYKDNTLASTQQAAMESQVVSSTGTQTANVTSTNTAILANTGSGAVLTFKDVTATYTVSIGQGSYSLSGQVLNFIRSYIVSISQGSYSLAGQSLSFTRSYAMSILAGIYSLTGYPIFLRYSGWIEEQRNSASVTNESSNSSAFTSQQSNGSTFTNQTKN